ncbi:MAG: class I SAM-dependent methyltransferase [Erysipelotrichaceae bacterium]|nr:class I SAM-dependent methyltransferase [Erysipelotrichaceae bacterium]
MTRKDEIRQAYKELGKAHGFYDGMMTGTTVMGRLVDRAVWHMNRDDILEYQARALEAIPADFAGKLLEVPVGTGVISLPFFRTLKKADITCLDYSAKMMESAQKRADELGINNVSFVQGDVGDLPFEDESFDAVVSLNGFHAFPDKEAAYRQTYRVLKKDGIFTGCFYAAEANRKTDRIIQSLYVRTGFFTPPFETVDSLRSRLEKLYKQVTVSNVQSIVCFSCRGKKDL